MQKKQCLVLGIGNEILSDDGIGIKLLPYLSGRFKQESIDFIPTCCGGLEILDLIHGYRSLIILDAIKTIEGEAGDIYYLGLDNFKETLHASSFHDLSFITALEFGRRSGLDIPTDICIIGIEIVEDMVFSTQFSPEISRRYRQIKEDVYQLMRKHLRQSFVYH